MPLIQGYHSGRAAVIPVAIIDVAKYREHKSSNEAIFRGAKPFHALIDTGATSTMISPRVISALGLQQVNQIRFGGLGGLLWRPAYLFHVAFYKTPPGDPNDVSNILICRKAINGGALTNEHTFDVLLGMDILTTGTLTVDRDGTFKFEF